MRRIIGTIGATLAIAVVLTTTAMPASASFHTEASGDHDVPSESISLNFAQIE
jgi:hypothetical protein